MRNMLERVVGRGPRGRYRTGDAGQLRPWSGRSRGRPRDRPPGRRPAGLEQRAGARAGRTHTGAGRGALPRRRPAAGDRGRTACAARRRARLGGGGCPRPRRRHQRPVGGAGHGACSRTSARPRAHSCICSRAAAAGLAGVLVDLPGLALDVDTPEDARRAGLLDEQVALGLSDQLPRLTPRRGPRSRGSARPEPARASPSPDRQRRPARRRSRSGWCAACSRWGRPLPAGRAAARVR